MALTRTLLANHWITASVALTALERYAEVRPSIGRVALREGMLKLGPLLHILDEQLEEGSLGDCRRFGEIAVTLGYLTRTQFTTLRARHAEVSPPFERVLIELGALDAVAERDEASLFPSEAPLLP